MEIVQATAPLLEQHAATFAELMFSTGASTYAYQFGTRQRFDRVVRESGALAGSLFGYDTTSLLVDGDRLLGAAVAFGGPEFASRKKALAPIWSGMIADGSLTQDELRAIGERTFECSFLNAAIPSRVYYLHALAVPAPEHGRGLGRLLFDHVIESARAGGWRGLHLDVLSDNPAVGFYRARGMVCLAETVAPTPFANGVPMEMRFAMDVSLAG